jgi:hypothetical protein
MADREVLLVKAPRFALALLVVVAAWGYAQTPVRCAEGMSIEEVVKMVESGWSDALAVKMVKTRGVAFAASVENINKLRARKISDKVLMAVIEAAGAKKSVPAEPKKPPLTQKPADPKLPPPDPKAGPDFAKKPPAAPTVSQKRKKCARCGSTGLLPCPRHRATDFVITSAMKTPPACCAGIGWVKCPNCAGEASEALVNQLKAELATRMGEWAKMDKATELKLFHGETRHFCLDTDLSPRKAAELAVTGENLITKLEALCRNRDFSFTRPASMRFVCLGRVDNFMKFTNWFGPYIKLKPEQRMRLAQSHGMTIYGRSGYSLCVRERTGKGYPSYVVNGFGHVLISHVYGYKGRMPAWIHEGFSTFCETLVLGKPGVWSFNYDPKDVDAGGDWKQAVKKAVRAGKSVPLETLMGKSLTAMKALDYQQAWSVNSALIYGGATKYQSLIKRIKNREDQTEALEKAYGQKIKQVELVWKNWAANQR